MNSYTNEISWVPQDSTGGKTWKTTDSGTWWVASDGWAKIGDTIYPQREVYEFVDFATCQYCETLHWHRRSEERQFCDKCLRLGELALALLFGKVSHELLVRSNGGCDIVLVADGRFVIDKVDEQ